MPVFKTLWILVLFSFNAQGTFLPLTHNPVSLGLGNITSFKTNPFVAYTHPGSLAFVKQNSISFGFESLFLVEGLNHACLSWNYRLNKRQILGIGYGFFGNTNYNEGLLKVALAQKISPSFGAGLSLDYMRLQLPQENFGVKHLLTVETGLYGTLSPNVDLAFHVINPFRPKIAEYMDERLPFVINSTFIFKANKHAIIAIEWHQIVNDRGQLRVGMSYKVSDKVSLRVGGYSRPINIGFGLSYSVKSLSIHIDFAMHPYLDMSSGAAITYTSANETQRL